jgi:hypothetical protein
MREAESVGGSLLRSGGQDRRDDPDLAVGGASGRVARALPGHALWSQLEGSGGSASRIVIGRSLVAGLAPRPDPAG